MHRFFLATIAAAGSTGVGINAFAQSQVDLPDLLIDPAAFQQASELRVNLGMLQDGSPPGAPLEEEDDGWRVDVTLWAWLVGMEGDIGARGRTADVNVSFTDVLDASDSMLGFSGRLEVGKGRWGGFIEGIGAKIGVEDQTGAFGRREFDITTEMIVIDFGAMYRICEWTPDGDAAANDRNGTIDLYGGARYLGLDIELDPVNRPSRSGDAALLDPIVGAKLVLPLAEHWHIMAQGDLGGFGVVSDLTWQAMGVLGYDFTLFDNPTSLYFGYRAIGWDFSEGSGNEETTWDVILHGPILGLSMRF